MLPSPGTGHDLTEAVLRPARGNHAFEACVEQLATTIRLGVYPLGSTLPSERELAERLGVSRSTLREAMAALREAGLVETRRGRGGGTVVDPQAADAVGPGGRPAHRGPPAASGSTAWSSGGSSSRARPAWRPVRSSTPTALAQLDEAHTAVADGPPAGRAPTGRLPLPPDGRGAHRVSPRMVEAVTSVQSTLHEMLLAIPVLDANIAHSDRQHAALVRAIRRGNHDRARAVMEEHCDDTAALLRGLLG